MMQTGGQKEANQFIRSLKWKLSQFHRSSSNVFSDAGTKTKPRRLLVTAIIRSLQHKKDTLSHLLSQLKKKGNPVTCFKLRAGDEC